MFIENVRIAMKSIRTNLLRTILTVMIIAFGIMALVGILTAIDSIKYALTESFSLMGANTFTIESRSMRVQIGNQSYQERIMILFLISKHRNSRSCMSFPPLYPYGQEHRVVLWSSINLINRIPTPRFLV